MKDPNEWLDSNSEFLVALVVIVTPALAVIALALLAWVVEALW